MKNRLTYLMTLALLAWCGLVQGGSLRVLTLNDPPFSMQVAGGQVGGMGTDIVRELLRRARFSYSIELQPWISAYNTSVLDENTCVYATARTDRREHQFKWVGPLLENPWVLYAGPRSPDKINKLEDVRPYKVGGLAGAAVAQSLVAQGFNIELTPLDDLNVQKLAAGQIDFWATGKYRGQYLTAQAKALQLKPVLEFGRVLEYLACNARMSNRTVLRLNRILNTMQRDGFIDQVRKHYLNE